MHDTEEAQQKKGLPKRKFQSISSLDEFKDLSIDIAHTADIAEIPDVELNICIDVGKRFYGAELDYREYKYTIIDDETFVREREV